MGSLVLKVSRFVRLLKYATLLGAGDCGDGDRAPAPEATGVGRNPPLNRTKAAAAAAASAAAVEPPPLSDPERLSGGLAGRETAMGFDAAATAVPPLSPPARIVKGGGRLYFVFFKACCVQRRQVGCVGAVGLEKSWFVLVE